MRKALAALGLGLCLFLPATSCIGPNNAFNGVNNWNSRLSDSKFVNELAFLGLNIIPVYGIAYLGDVFIFNSLEFWGVENPISPSEPFETQTEK